jgi:NitT/TauT family transport system permease protein
MTPAAPLKALDHLRPSTWLPTLLLAALVLVVWQSVVWLWALPPILLPSPRAVVLAAWETRAELFQGAIVTGGAAIAGFSLSILVGIAVAALMSQSRVLRLALYPYVILLQTVPIVAIAPLLVIWSGYTFRTVVLVTLIISLFPIINSVAQGLLAIPQERLDLFRLYGASRVQTLWRLRVPTAVNYLMLGARTSSGLAVIGAIVAEFFVGNGGANYSGLGTLMTGWQTLGRTAPLMAALCISTLIGIIMFASVEAISRTLLKRWMSYE